MTLSKSLGSQGGAVLGRARVIDHLVNTARPFIFDTGLAPAGGGAALAALRRAARRAASVAARRTGNAALLAEDRARARRRDRRPGRGGGAGLRRRSASRGRGRRGLLDAGVRVGCFRPPSVPAGPVVPAADRPRRT